MKPELTLDSIRDINLYQNKRGYRFSVDALLLYAFVNVRKSEKIADLGAGSGIVGILLAKQYPEAWITLIELQESLVKLAKRNVALNNLEERVKVIKADVKKISHQPSAISYQHYANILKPNSFDLVVSNPPFRRQKTGLISPTGEKAIARHEIELKLTDLIHASCSLLRSKGRLCLIYHPSRLVELIDTLRKNRMEPKRLRLVHSTLHTEAKMALVEAVKEGRAEMKIERPLCIYNKDCSYTDEMKEIILTS